MSTIPTPPSFSTASVQEVSELASRSLLLDVRTPAEYEGAHIPDSVLHPLGELNASGITKLSQGKDACILICASGKRARMAAEKLTSQGLNNLRVLDGGITAWEQHGLPLNRGRNVISLERQVRIAAGSIVFCGAILTYFSSPLWIVLPAFVGAGLVFAGITDTCGMALILAKMPWNNRRHSCCRRDP